MTATTSMIEQFKEAIRAEWTDPLTVEGWSRWAAKQGQQTKQITDALIAAAHLAPGQQVLDLATGTGEPAVTIAGIVGPSGRVTASDLGSGMLGYAASRARERALANITFEVADAHDLPFGDSLFDRVTCRWGVMYFADSVGALREVRRVLKPGGRAAFAAWGPITDNPFFLTALGPFMQRIPVPHPPEGAPQPFKHAAPGSLSAELREAGFTTVEESTLALELIWPGPPEEVWQYIYDTGVMLHPVFNGLPAKERSEAISEVIAGYRAFDDGSAVRLPASIVIASAVK